MYLKMLNESGDRNEEARQAADHQGGLAAGPGSGTTETDTRSGPATAGAATKCNFGRASGDTPINLRRAIWKTMARRQGAALDRIYVAVCGPTTVLSLRTSKAGSAATQ